MTWKENSKNAHFDKAQRDAAPKILSNPSATRRVTFWFLPIHWRLPEIAPSFTFSERHVDLRDRPVSGALAEALAQGAAVFGFRQLAASGDAQRVCGVAACTSDPPAVVLDF